MANKDNSEFHPKTSPSPNPRMVAYQVLMRVEGEGGYSNLALNAALNGTSLAPRDKAFVTRLVYGVLENTDYLDHVISGYAKAGARLEPEVRCILRMAVYQMAFMDTPDSAAVNESVNLAKKCKLFRATGFINGLLRSFLRDGKQVRLPDRQKEPLLWLCVKYSCPAWLVTLWRDAYGEAVCEQILQSLAERPPIFARVNTVKTSAEALKDSLEHSGVKAALSDVLPDCLLLEQTGSVRELPPYREGLFHVQDGSSQLCSLLAAPKKGETVYDVCAAPGGKSFTMAELMENSGKVIACDLHAHRVGLIAEGAQRLGLNCVEARVRDALETAGEETCADLVLCDVPCSGLGIIRRKPDIKRKAADEAAALPSLQAAILEHSAGLVRPGGRLVYSTCTLNPAENGGVIASFLAAHPDFEPLALALPKGVERAIDEPDYMLTVFPQMIGTDGFFISLIRKKP